MRCLQCASDLAFLPDRLGLFAVEPVPQEPGLWRTRNAPGRKPGSRRWRLCQNNVEKQACNFAVPADDPNPLCVSCRQTRILPDLSVADNHARWFRIEQAKRRLFYTLARLGLASTRLPDGRSDGPVYEFLADLPGQQVMTGHCNGVITLNIAEADDEERVRRRIALHEPYRTLLGHLRHESGHYYWDRLVRDGGHTEGFRRVFGDESLDYGQALAHHYANGAPASWPDTHVSAYATAHPWEDWAETWAHYLHMVDLLETAASYNTRLSVLGSDGEEIEEVVNPFEGEAVNFDALVEQWVPLTLLVNSLNRSLGQEDAYPFALSPAALEKLRYVHDLIRGVRQQPAANGAAAAPAAAAPGAGGAAPVSACDKVSV